MIEYISLIPLGLFFDHGIQCGHLASSTPPTVQIQMSRETRSKLELKFVSADWKRHGQTAVHCLVFLYIQIQIQAMLSVIFLVTDGL